MGLADRAGATVESEASAVSKAVKVEEVEAAVGVVEAEVGKAVAAVAKVMAVGVEEGRVGE